MLVSVREWPYQHISDVVGTKVCHFIVMVHLRLNQVKGRQVSLRSHLRAEVGQVGHLPLLLELHQGRVRVGVSADTHWGTRLNVELEVEVKVLVLM